MTKVLYGNSFIVDPFLEFMIGLRMPNQFRFTLDCLIQDPSLINDPTDENSKD